LVATRGRGVVLGGRRVVHGLARRGRVAGGGGVVAVPRDQEDDADDQHHGDRRQADDQPRRGARPHRLARVLAAGGALAVARLGAVPAAGGAVLLGGVEGRGGVGGPAVDGVDRGHPVVGHVVGPTGAVPVAVLVATC